MLKKKTADESSSDGDDDDEENKQMNIHSLKEQRDRNRQRIRKRRHNSSLYQYSIEITTAKCDLDQGDDSENSKVHPVGAPTADASADTEVNDSLDVVVEEKVASREHPRITKECMTENVFSLIYTAPVNSAAFWMGMFVSFFQIAMPSLALLDLVVFSDVKNPLQVPNSVSLQVRIIGVMALILAVSQFWDFMEAIEKLERGPPPHSSSYTPPGATCWKFYLAYTLQFVMGTLFHITIFTLVVQSTTVIGMFLNFAALEFITTVDDVAFALGKRGYFTNSIKKACDEVSEVIILRRKGGRVPRRIQLLVITATLVGMYTYIIFQELGGRFYCNRIEAQFGDGFNTIQPLFSGVYYYESDFHDGRPVYWDTRKKAAFRYCGVVDDGIFAFAESGFWVFNVLSKETKSINDMCTNYLSRSPNTKGYDILEQPPNLWLTKHRVTDTIEYVVDYMSLSCVDCSPTNCNGNCINGECACAEGQFGLHCQFVDSPCEETDFDRRTGPFSGAGITYSSTYKLLRDSNNQVAVGYHRPIYSYVNAMDEIDILMNLGRRYFLFYLNASLIDGVSDVSEDSEVLADYLENVHPYYDWIEPVFVSRKNETMPFHLPVFVSDPIDVGTATDNASPLSLSWWRVNRVELDTDNYFDMFLIGGHVDTVLLCATCSKISPCENQGVCDTRNRRCQCTFGHVGRLCEADCWETPGSDLCPRCFEEYKWDSTCQDCYRNSNSLDCPDCRKDPFALDCIDCFGNYSSAGCKGEVRDGAFLGPRRLYS